MITLQQDTIYMGTAAPASGGGGSGTVDQTYDPTSTNAQSGTAVAEALATVTVATDNSTISKDASNELQAIGLKEARTDTAIRLWHGTEEQWEDGVSQTWYNWKYGTGYSEQEYSLPSGNNWGAISYGNGNFVVVPGNAFTTDIAYSSDNGETWTSVTMPGESTKRWWGIAYGGGKFVATSYNDTIVAYSSDGVTWSTASIPDYGGLGRRTVAIAYGGGRFVCMLQLEESTCIYSEDGEHWYNGGNINSGNNMWALTYGDGKFVGIQGVNNSSNAMAYSTDGGETWTAGTMPSSKQWNSVAYGNNKFVAVANGGVFAYSSNGIDWTESTMPSALNWMSIKFANGEFVAISSSNKLAYSSDGVNWTEKTLTTNTDWIDIGYGNDTFVAISKTSHLAAQITGIDSSECYTLEQNPTTTSTVYSAPNTASALTITATGEGTITLSDTNTYNYNASGNQTTYQSIGEAHPNYLCFINNVGIKMGNVSFTPVVDQTYSASSTNAQSGVAVASGIADTLGTIETALQGV